MDKPKFYCFEVDGAWHSNRKTVPDAAAEFAKNCGLDIGIKIAVVNSNLVEIYEVTNGVKLHVE